MLELQQGVLFCTGIPKECPNFAMNSKCKEIKENSKSHNRRQRQYIAFWFTPLCFLGLLVWNVQLQHEVHTIRQDLDYLRIFVESSCSLGNENKNAIRQTYVTLERNDLSSVEKNDVESNLKKNVVHGIVKRDVDENAPPKYIAPVRNRRSRKRKGFSKKTIRRFLSKNKAIGVHVRAGNDRGQSLPTRETGAETINNIDKTIGRALTTWKTPDPDHYFGFDTSNLRTTGKIKVPTDGMYFVYSQVVFATRENSYSVSEIKAGYEGGNVFVQCQYRGRETTVNPRLTCNSNGLVYLQKNDEISIRVHPADLEVLLESEYTYFGAFLVGL